MIFQDFFAKEAKFFLESLEFRALHGTCPCLLDEDPTPGNGIVIDAETVENRAGNPHHHIGGSLSARKRNTCEATFK